MAGSCAAPVPESATTNHYRPVVLRHLRSFLTVHAALRAGLNSFRASGTNNLGTTS